MNWIHYKEARALGSSSLHLSQPLLRIFDFRNARVSVLPEGEEFLIMLYGLPSSLSV
jgi:hypothetical protein